MLAQSQWATGRLLILHCLSQLPLLGPRKTYPTPQERVACNSTRNWHHVHASMVFYLCLLHMVSELHVMMTQTVYNACNQHNPVVGCHHAEGQIVGQILG